MYELNLNNRFYRVYAATVDRHGVDPLLDRVIPHLRSITAFKNHDVTQDERGAPDLISFREYGNEDFWWHILAYNGICSYRDVVEGTTLKIPNLGDIVAITNDYTSDNPNQTADNIITI